MRPQTHYDYTTQQVYIKDASGAMVAQTPIYLLSKVTQCRKDSCSATEATVTTYEYPTGAALNALLPKGQVVSADGVTLRTCYAYDRYGRKTSETAARAGLAVCP